MDQSTLKDAKRYLRQQKELGTDEVYLDAPVAPVDQGIQTLSTLRDEASVCTLCSELATRRNNVIFGEGDEHASLLLIGEAPGRDEDLQGQPFVGRAGQLLTKILESVDFHREDVYITNILKCRPPNNRDPNPVEIANCQRFLIGQIHAIRPKLICLLGRISTQTLLSTKKPLSALRGMVYTIEGVKAVPTYHPAALLRDPRLKRPVWDDIRFIRKEHDMAVEGGGK